ncbi:hypothetical protein ACFFWC_16275 [Plantactinospora siamensis]|uniref:Uncharacterized protein n=1 Tax=Plantactinospora siamensis TaxID=555372 RepID=A0ABV6NVG6_9ACTN
MKDGRQGPLLSPYAEDGPPPDPGPGRGDVRAGEPPAEAPAGPGAADVSPAMIAGYLLLGVLLLGWFLWGWLVLRQGFIDSVGESAGAGFALLLLFSIVGTLRQSRR